MLLFWISAAVSFALSLAFKFIGDAFFTERIPLLGDFLALQLTHNPGIAFGLRFAGEFQLPLILAALGFVAYLAYHSERTPLNQWGYGLIIGGALGNVLDRIPDGLVTDFVRVGSFPVFNMADSCITVGVCLLLVSSVLDMRLKSAKRSG